MILISQMKVLVAKSTKFAHTISPQNNRVKKSIGLSMDEYPTILLP